MLARHVVRALAAAALAWSLAGLAGAPAHGQEATSFQGQSQAAGTLNSSAVIATGNTFQTVLPALTSTAYPGTPARRSLTINNNNATDSCWIFIGSGSASKGASILLTAGQTYRRDWPYVPSDAIQATCTTTSDTLYVDTQ